MICDKAFKERVLIECYDALELEGFSRLSRFSVNYPIHEGFLCWVGLNAALYSDRIELVPNIGLHVVDIEKMVCTLDEGPYAVNYDAEVCTYSINIGEIDVIGTEPAFEFSPKQSDQYISSECKRLAKIYKKVGIEYIKPLASYEAVAPLIKQEVDSLGGNPERYASCLYLMGDKRGAQSFLNDFPESLKEYIKGFSGPFLSKVSEEL